MNLTRLNEDSDVYKIARICHEANAAYCRGLGDHSQPHWEEASDWQKESCVNGVAFMRANKENTPKSSHENWLRHKTLQGWTYGPVKDADKKEHPCMVPYEKLPEDQKLKDRLFTAIVRCFE